MATVRKRQLPSGLTVWVADYADRDGKRRWKNFERRKDADSYLVKVRADLQMGTHVAPGASITVLEAGQRWIAQGQLNKLARSTLAQYSDHLDLHIAPALGPMKLSEVTGPIVSTFVQGMIRQTSHATARKILVSLKSIFTVAIADGLAAVNPAAAIKVKIPRSQEEDSGELEMPSKAELKAIITGVTGRWRPLIITAIFSGMRGSELRGLQWQDVDLKGAMIKVRRRADAWDQMGPPKSKAGRRDIPVPPLVVQALREWKLVCTKTELDLVFPAQSGGVLSHSVILKDIFHPLQVQLGITKPGSKGEPMAKYGLHALRHAAVSLWIEQGLQPKQVQKLAGHASIVITYVTYGHLFTDDSSDKAAMAAIEARLLK